MRNFVYFTLLIILAVGLFYLKFLDWFVLVLSLIMIAFKTTFGKYFERSEFWKDQIELFPEVGKILFVTGLALFFRDAIYRYFEKGILKLEASSCAKISNINPNKWRCKFDIKNINRGKTTSDRVVVFAKSSVNNITECNSLPSEELNIKVVEKPNDYTCAYKMDLEYMMPVTLALDIVGDDNTAPEFKYENISF